MDTTKEDLRSQIELIESTLNSAHRFSFPRRSLFTYGILILGIPFYEKFLPQGNWWPHFVFYGLLFGIARQILHRFFQAWEGTGTHPLIVKALKSQQRFSLLSLIFVSFALHLNQQPELVFPMAMLHLSFLFYSFGKFSSKFMKQTAYGQLLFAAGYIALLKTQPPEVLLPVFTTLLGVSVIATGLRNES